MEIDSPHPVDEQPTVAVAPQEQVKPVRIYCIFTANPIQLKPNSTSWFKDGQLLGNVLRHSSPGPIESADAHLVESQTSTGYPVLNIMRPNRRDAGRYECQVSNAVGVSERLPMSETSKLEINFRPSVEMRAQRVLAELVPERETVDDFHPEQSLLLAGTQIELVCQVLEAKPTKIDKFYWFSRAAPTKGSTSKQEKLLGVTDSNKLKLAPVGADFRPTSFACAANNSLGQSDPSNWVHLQLSRAPGKFHLIFVAAPPFPALHWSTS